MGPILEHRTNEFCFYIEFPNSGLDFWQDFAEGITCNFYCLLEHVYFLFMFARAQLSKQWGSTVVVVEGVSALEPGG